VRANRLRQWVADLVRALFCGFFSWKSWTLFDEALTEGYRTSSNWAPPQWIPYSLMALGMSLLTVQIVLQLMPGTAPDRVNEGHA
jgi:TRAP-type C4-dicarboxylate transport system permease small subunit